jgi:hypothetical protein
MTLAALVAIATLAASPAPPPASPAPPVAQPVPLASPAATAQPVAPAAYAAPAPPDGTYYYDLSLAGELSTSTIKVQRMPDGLHITDNSDLTGHLVTATLVLNSTSLAPASYAATYDVGTGHSQDMSISFGTVVASVNSFGQQITLEAQPGAPHMVLLDGALPSGFFVLPAAAAAARDSSLTAINAGAFAADVLSLNRSISVPRPANVPPGDVVVSVVSPNPFSVWYDPNTFVMHELDVPLQNVVEKFVKFVAATGKPSAVALARRGEVRRDARYSAAVLTARY